ncbi:PREDICTED: cytochrome b5 reductase 4 [Nanorana parkeri]|uniref:cytochrome b5 reductase 4 n=1 Tax=Nanorana parkeri TaxID=125878 RepID=UPI00085421D4|nr:PREDICTED: cytochrome b5 reductase 4 [Nanorana parkeri]
MLNVPTPSFPVPNSQQRVSAGGRNKTPLKPGRSLMDWVRVKSSSKDLTGLRGRLIEVTEEELAKHNKKSDCWICIRGLVYNVTPYMEYHPGGEEELMKAAGADGTQLFDEVHRWVNYESMLKECLVGRMAIKHTSLLKGAVSESQLPYEDKPFHPRYEWFQTDANVTVVIYTKQKNIKLNLFTVDYQEDILRVEITIKDYSYLLLIELEHAVQAIQVNASGNAGKVELALQKKDCTVWKSLGQSLEENNSFVKSSKRGHYYRKCRLTSKMDVSHNTRLFCFALPQDCHLEVPVGYHIYLNLTISGVDVVKPYTPVSQTLESDQQQTSHNNEKCVYIMIKIYPNGSFTPMLDNMQIGDFILMSNPQGCFSTSQVDEVEDIFLLVAGTGFTPTVKLLRHVLNHSNILRKVKLIFFNKTEHDILWREQLEKLSSTDRRFESQFVLSEPSDSWTGCKGKISTSFLSETIQRSKDDSTILICICGPNGFVEQAERSLEDLGFSKEEIFVFRE